MLPWRDRGVPSPAADAPAAGCPLAVAHGALVAAVHLGSPVVQARIFAVARIG